MKRWLVGLSLAASLVATTSVGASRRTIDRQHEAAIVRIKAAMLSDPAQAIRLSQASLNGSKVARSAYYEATSLWLLGEAHIRTDQPTRGEMILAQARRLAERVAPGSRLHADILLSEGSARAATGNVAPALNDLQRAHNIFRTLGDARSQAKSLIMIALLHFNAKDNSTALRYFGQAIEIYDADSGLLLAIHNGRANVYMELGDFRAANGEYARALAIARNMGSDLLVAQVLSNIVRTQLKTAQLASAHRTIQQGLRLAASSDAAASRPVFVALAAQAWLQQGDLVQAERLIDERFAGVDPTKTILLDREAHDAAYHIYQRRGRVGEALAHLAALKRLDDQATDLARSNSAALAGARFDFANQELRIAKLKADDLQQTVAFERDRSRSERTIFTGAAVATLLIIALLGFGLFTIRRSRNKLAVTNVALGKALAAKTEFLATTSHEIRTPLNGILGMTQVMLADRALDDATRDRLSLLHDAGTTMRALVDDILDVAKMESGRMTIEAVALDVRATVADAARIWGEQARAKRLDFTLALDDDLGWIVGDAGRIRQIVFNLLSNAVKFTPAGYVTLTTACVGDRWRLHVADSGIGIAADKHEMIFESFRQADAGTTRQFGGTGLGLSICRSLSRAMGGDVTVDSRLGEGAVFTLDLPLIRAAASIDDDAAAGVLVIDRNPIARAMFRALLEPRGGSVVFADGVDEAVAVLHASQVTTVLIDDATARRSGDLSAAVAAIATAATGATTIAILGPPLDPREVAAMLAAGATTTIAKPIAKDRLVAALFGDEPSLSALVPQAA